MGVFTHPRPRRPRTRSLTASAPRATSAAHLRPAPSSAHRATPLPYTAVRSLTGAARSINLHDREEVQRLSRRRGGDDWQSEAWEYYDAIGEVKYAFSLVANVLSRIRLYAAEVTDPAETPSTANPDAAGGAAARAALARLDSAFGGQPGLLRDAALNLQVAGECYLVQQPGQPHIEVPESWDVRSVDELTVDANGNTQLQTRRDDPKSRVTLPKRAFVARIWRAHPRYSDEPDASMKGVLDLAAELLLLNRTFRSTARSRLNAGMLYLPDGLSVAATPDTDVEVEDLDPLAPVDTSDTDDSDDFEDALIEAMSTPITDEESASAVVPLLVRGPAELADRIKHFKFERSFDAHLVQRSDRVLDRIMQGIDVPKDIVTGLSNVKYSNAVVIEDSLYRSHVEPLIVLICDALTVVYLRPALRAAGVDPSEINKYVVWYDPSQVTFHPNKAEDADQGFDRKVVSGSAWRRAHGFSDEDAPTPTEIAVRMLEERGPVTPELAEALLAVIAPEVMDRVRAASQAASPAPLPPEVAQALGVPSPDSPETPGEGGGGEESPAPAAPPPSPGPSPAPPPAAPRSAPTPAPAPATPSAPTAPPTRPEPPRTIREEDLV